MAAAITDIKKKKDREELQEMMAMRLMLTSQKADVEENLKAVNETISAILKRYDIKSMGFTDSSGQPWTFTMMNGANTSISARDLLTKGVDPAIIEECTKRTEYTTVQARKVKKEDE